MVKSITHFLSGLSASTFKKRILAVAACSLISSSLYAGNAADYAFTTSTGVALEDLSSGATGIFGTGLDDNASTTFPIGFTFYFGNNTPYTSFSVSTNGLMALGNTPTVDYTDGSLDDGSPVYPAITPYWRDLLTGTNGGVNYKLIGSVPNRKLVVEFNVRSCCSNGSFDKTMQIWLNENGSTINFVYGTGTNPGGGTIGIATSASDFLSVTAAASPTADAVTSNNNNNYWPSSGTSYNFSSNTPLPVKLISFAAQQKAAVVSLDWKVAEEHGMLAYDVERSSEGVSFEKIGSVAATGKTSDYNFIDYSPLNKNAYYRLRMMEVNGTFNYSPVSEIHSTDRSGHSLQVAPQPASQMVMLTNLNAGLNGTPVTITNVTGSTVYQSVLSQQQNIDVSAWANGIYLIKLSNGEVTKMTKQ